MLGLTDIYTLVNSEDKNLILNFDETRKYPEIMKKERNRLIDKKHITTTISMYSALQFQMTNDFAYSCTAGEPLLTVVENGDLVPCRRMPIVVSNIPKDNMYDLYKNNKALKDLRIKKCLMIVQTANMRDVSWRFKILDICNV